MSQRTYIFETMFEVLGRLGTLVNAVVEFRRPHPSLPAATDGRRIWIDPKMTMDEQRCSLAHEVFHLIHGHTSCQPPAVERQIRMEAAQWLVPFQSLQKVAGWAKSPAELAEELGVTEQVVMDRLATLDGDQIQALWPPSDHIA